MNINNTSPIAVGSYSTQNLLHKIIVIAVCAQRSTDARLDSTN